MNWGVRVRLRAAATVDEDDDEVVQAATPATVLIANSLARYICRYTAVTRALHFLRAEGDKNSHRSKQNKQN